MRKQCTKCNVVYSALFVKRFETKSGRLGTTAYVDQDGRRVYDNVCFDCRTKQRRKCLGIGSREESGFHKTRKAIWAEKLAEKKFQELGFSTKRTNFFGPDIVCKMGDLTYSVEVKSVSLNVRSEKYFWYYVGAVHENRRGDDLVALVMPNGRVYIDSMKHHLSECNKSGARTVTQLVKEIGLVFDKTSL